MKKSEIIINNYNNLKNIGDLLEKLEILTKWASENSIIAIFFYPSDLRNKMQSIVFAAYFLGFFEFCYFSLFFRNIGCLLLQIQETDLYNVFKTRINVSLNDHDTIYGFNTNTKKEYTNKNKRDISLNLHISYPIGCLT
ncbi:hypothetical protein DSAG12_02239 [Promethearchaeum syntrophicum]|uniref:Uncharacterized protein n=1 Tax=Promethearchaeum syntrophicum TaxID=2594042 RepID=A0A5B9DAY3_9ARCH|nr:hypothetical protein [Candidatus Prometheoarchaeum syntrophicum]QEE16409.1 hypothetical protein DSAG12_02239 [Candidatus Prometheoarchaeum syntrophicum]